MKILCTADLHLGRRSSRVPEDMAGPLFSSAEAWRRVVDLALAEKVDLVLLGGDLIDRSNRFYEAFGPLEKGLTRLTKAGIRSVAVAGNHDHDSLRGFLAASDGLDLVLLGAGQAWESLVVKTRDGKEKLQILGWSFTKPRHRRSPVQDWTGGVEPGVPSLGLVHAELDAAQGVYAPVTSGELASLGLDVIVVGHFHRSYLNGSEARPLILVPGSPQALDPGESGPHGPWLLETSQGVFLPPRQVPVSTVRYEEARVDLGGTDQEDLLSSGLINAVRDLRERIGSAPGPLELLCLRLVLEGRTALHGRLQSLTREATDSLSLESSRPRTVVDKVVIQTRPPLDLEGLAGSGGLTAHLAGLILDIENQRTGPEQGRLVQEALEKLSRFHQAGPYLNLDQEPPRPDRVRELIVDQAFLLLEALLEQKGRI